MCVGQSASLAPCLAQGRLCLHFGVEEAMVFLFIDKYTCKHTSCPQKSLIGRQTKAEHGIWPKTTSDYVILPGLLLCRMDNISVFSSTGKVSLRIPHIYLESPHEHLHIISAIAMVKPLHFEENTFTHRA